MGKKEKKKEKKRSSEEPVIKPSLAKKKRNSTEIGKSGHVNNGKVKKRKSQKVKAEVAMEVSQVDEAHNVEPDQNVHSQQNNGHANADAAKLKEQHEHEAADNSDNATLEEQATHQQQQHENVQQNGQNAESAAEQA